MPSPIYVIPDIHGHLDILEQALALIEAHAGSDAQIVFLGDYVDRGPEARGVLQTLIDGAEADRNWIAIRGNHDQLLLDAVTQQMPDEERLHWWLSDRMGGSTTLASYGVYDPRSKIDWHGLIPDEHRFFLQSLPYSFETDDLFFCHAGVQPGVPLDQQSTNDLIWIREPFLSDNSDHGKLVVHGHTPVDHPRHYGNRVALDGGTAWGRQLHVAVFEGRKAWLLKGAGRAPLEPQPQDDSQIWE